MPRGEKIRVTPEVLTWAREHAGLSLADCKRALPNIERWETGEDSPTYPKLEQLSKKFRVPVAVFFFPEPPAVPSIRESFRSLPDAEFRAFPQLLLRKAKALQINLSELHDGRNPVQSPLPQRRRLRPNANIPSMARRIREDLGIPLEQQIGWDSKKTAFDEWRQAFERQGIAVFKDAFRNDSFSGFCLYEEAFPLIYVNNSARSREIFTLFHELAHILLRTSGIVPPPAAAPISASSEEIFCNRFASEFLLPDAHFSATWNGRRADKDAAEELADFYKVSREVVFRRFLDKELISPKEYKNAASEWARQRKSGGSGGNSYRTKLSCLGMNYVRLAFSKYYQERITASELAEYLDIQERHLPRFEEYFEEKL